MLITIATHPFTGELVAIAPTEDVTPAIQAYLRRVYGTPPMIITSDPAKANLKMKKHFIVKGAPRHV